MQSDLGAKMKTNGTQAQLPDTAGASSWTLSGLPTGVYILNKQLWANNNLIIIQKSSVFMMLFLCHDFVKKIIDFCVIQKNFPIQNATFSDCLGP